MAFIISAESEQLAVLTTATLMATAARTAPKTRGMDSVKTLIVTGEELETLAGEMEAKVEAKAFRIGAFARDAGSVRRALAVLLIGVTGEPKNAAAPLSCGACGNMSCGEFVEAEKREGEDFRGPLCMFQSVDLGIALGAAVKVAGEMNVDNRIMYTVGAAARKLGWPAECDVVIGVPLSVSGKSPFFDR